MLPSTSPPHPTPILVAEDSKFDRLILIEAFQELGFSVALTFVSDGEELLGYLRRCNVDHAAPPALILMDLNMSPMNGIDALKALRADLALRALPVVVLSTSDDARQIALAYANGVNTYLTKPCEFEAFVDLLRNFGAFWLQSAKLPDITSIN